MKRIVILAASFLAAMPSFAQGVVFNRSLSPAEGLVKPQESPCRAEICLDGLWEVQCMAVPDAWKPGGGVAPELPEPAEGAWESVKLKVPSPLNVNGWGAGFRTGEGTDHPFTPSSVYFPSYPQHWAHARMAWLRRSFKVPSEWEGKRLKLHFEAVAGDCRVIVNGVEVGRHFENHLPFELDVTDAVRPGGENEILLGIRHHKLFDRKHPDYPYMGATYPTGSNTDDLLGPWQDVFLEAVPEVSIEDVFVQPYVQRGELVMEVTVRNDGGRTERLELGADIHEWLNLAGGGDAEAAEIAWTLSDRLMSTGKVKFAVKPGQAVKLTLSRKIAEGELKLWSPDSPSLYTAVFHMSDRSGDVDVRTERFGWRELRIVGDEFRLNGRKIQCFGDIQHPFSAYVCSRRFAWAWYRMIKDFGGNAVRPHAQPWPRCYYDLADEMGLLVLDETGLFGSSIRMNFEEDETWQRCEQQLESLIFRDRNHPSVIGWSAGNETFAIALLNKAPESVARVWNDKLVKLALHALECDPTRDFVTLDGDRDMDGRLPVWSKHFGHGLTLADLPSGLGKPLVVGENGATYYGKPDQLVQFAGMLPYIDYKGRNEALARDLYQNVKYMALPYLAYFSPSEVSWFGIEHMNLGYHDFSRLPALSDGVFPGLEYEENIPGYQYERIPPYVTTFNPGLDPELPLYKPLAMFDAYKAALAGEDWAAPDPTVPGLAPEPADHVYSKVFVVGGCSPQMASFLGAVGAGISDSPSEDALLIVDASTVSERQLDAFGGRRMLALTCDGSLSADFRRYLPCDASSITYPCTGLESADGSCLPSELYFGGEKPKERTIAVSAITGDILSKARLFLVPSRTDWTLFNDVAEHWKCAQVVLYESLEKPEAACLLSIEVNGTGLVLSTIDYRNCSARAVALWRRILGREGLVTKEVVRDDAPERRMFNLLLDGPVD